MPLGAQLECKPVVAIIYCLKSIKMFAFNMNKTKTNAKYDINSAHHIQRILTHMATHLISAETFIAHCLLNVAGKAAHTIRLI